MAATYLKVQGWTGTKIWPWTFWSRPAHYNPRADIVPTRPAGAHRNTHAISDTTILNNIPFTTVWQPPSYGAILAAENFLPFGVLCSFLRGWWVIEQLKGVWVGTMKQSMGGLTRLLGVSGEIISTGDNVLGLSLITNLDIKSRGIVWNRLSLNKITCT